MNFKSLTGSDWDIRGCSTYLSISGTCNWAKTGFQIALDDFMMDDQVEVYDELFEQIDYIKVDF